MSEWRDISEAPRDGTEILVCGPLKTGRTYLEVQKWFRSEHHKDGGFWPVVWMQNCEEPTHWQLLPEPPSADHQAQAGSMK